VVKVFYIKTPRWLNAGVYVAMGWLCLLAVGQMPATLSVNAIVWLIIGGVIYTLGAVVYATKTMNFWPGKFGFHEVWHIFVLLAAIAHYIAVMSVIVRSR
jgi:hemolysin III